MSARELLRWAWRQLTSMRTALILLFLLALAAIPGSVIPQSDVDAFAVSQLAGRSTRSSPRSTRSSQLFSVFDSAWFSAIYLLLVVSLVGCILPRTRRLLARAAGRPPVAPRNLTRLPDHASYTTSERGRGRPGARRGRCCGKRRFRRQSSDDGSVSAERGYLREAGNLLFHLSVLVVLVGFAIGSLWGYRAA